MSEDSVQSKKFAVRDKKGRGSAFCTTDVQRHRDAEQVLGHAVACVACNPRDLWQGMGREGGLGGDRATFFDVGRMGCPFCCLPAEP
jgi:hypothetical protein